MFPQRRELRRWALGVLLVWVFGVGLGVANACLAAMQFEGGRGATPAMADPSRAAADAMPAGCEHHTVGAMADRDQGDLQSGSGRSNCESFCERAGVPVPPQKSLLDDLPGHVFLPAALASIAPVLVAQPSRLAAAPRLRARPLPIIIMFLRLAL